MKTKKEAINNIAWFYTYENLLEKLATEESLKIPRITGGKNTFFSDFSSWFNQSFTENGNAKDTNITRRVILPDPLLNLPLPYPYDEIETAIINSRDYSPSKEEIINEFKNYGLSENHLFQTISSLSGGEKLLLNFIKADIYIEKANKLIICSPFKWLNKDNYKYLYRLVNKCKYRNKIVKFYLMKGEPIGEILTVKEENHPPLVNLDIEPLRWDLTIDNLSIEFPEVNFPKFNPAKKLDYKCNDKMKLTSPTILTGDNGVGKSVFSKLLCSVLKQQDGNFEVVCAGATGKARLLMQDCLDQLFGQTIINHFERVFEFDNDKRIKAKNIYNEIQSKISGFVAKREYLPNDIIGNFESPNTLLQSKIALIAERIVSQPPLLILDEPSWSISKEIAQIFVSTACNIAHNHGIAVLIVSHIDDWWKPLIKSEITMQKKQDYILIEKNYE